MNTTCFLLKGTFSTTQATIAVHRMAACACSETTEIKSLVLNTKNKVWFSREQIQSLNLQVAMQAKGYDCV